MSTQFVGNLLQNKAAPVYAAGASCVIGFDLHTLFGYIGQVVGILSGAASLAWVVYQYVQSKRKPK